MTPEGVARWSLQAKDENLQFLWIYYGYPSSTYEGISVERMRYNCGAALAKEMPA